MGVDIVGSYMKINEFLQDKGLEVAPIGDKLIVVGESGEELFSADKMIEIGEWVERRYGVQLLVER